MPVVLVLVKSSPQIVPKNWFLLVHNNRFLPGVFHIASSGRTAPVICESCVAVAVVRLLVMQGSAAGRSVWFAYIQ